VAILIAVGVAVVLGIAVFAWQSNFSGGGDEAYTVEPYTPQTELISARERVPGHDAPDGASETVVVFGQSVTLMVTGRVARGLGNDWYAVAWNGRTVFVRQQDVVAGSGAPPTPVVREEEEEEEIIEEKPAEEELEEEEIVEAPSPGGTLDIGDVAWAREPNARDFARYFPRRALDSGTSGRVVLDCGIAGNGRLDCSVASESPGGQGFGQAAMSISRQLRVRSTLPDGSPAAGRRMRLPLTFQAG
jgi:TonB family protein